MRVLCHGIPFFCDFSPIERYRGLHEIRRLGFQEGAYYRFDPKGEDAPELLERIIRDWSPDLLLCWAPEIYPPPQRVEHAPIPTLALVSDWNLYYPQLAVNLSRFDWVLCDKPGTVALRNDLATPQHLFPLYSHISSIHRPHDVPKDLDVVFLGNLNPAAHPVRATYIEKLILLSDRYRVFVGSGIEGEAYAHVLSRARMVFNHSIRGELNLRVFETFACRALAFIEDSNIEVRDWFEDGREIILYNSSNFLPRLTYFIERPDEADRIAARGHARAQEFAAENRFDALINWVAAQPSGKRAFCALDPIEQEYQTLLMYGGSRWPEFYPIEKQLVSRLASLRPNDPRIWSAVGRHLLNPNTAAANEDERQRQYLKAFEQARRLAPESLPHALNAATAFRMAGMTNHEIDCLYAALNATSLEDSELVLGSIADPFWVRWMRTTAEKKNTTVMLHAEARIRLAAALARLGAVELAEEQLTEASFLDPENLSGVRLTAELQWARGEQEAAVETMKRFLPQMPLDPSYRKRLVDMLSALGHDRESAQYHEELRKISSIYFG